MRDRILRIGVSEIRNGSEPGHPIQFSALDIISSRVSITPAVPGFFPAADQVVALERFLLYLLGAGISPAI